MKFGSVYKGLGNTAQLLTAGVCSDEHLGRPFTSFGNHTCFRAEFDLMKGSGKEYFIHLNYRGGFA